MVLVAEAQNGRDAIEKFTRHRPDITLMDLQMPEMDDLDALETIRGTEGSAFADGSARPAHYRPPQNSNKDIAAHLNITEEVIKGQVRNILAKLGANDRTRAAVICIERGIIS